MYRFFKRVLDIFISAFALLVLALPLAAVTAAVRVKLGSPVIFKQARPGLRGKIFTLRKFRTMTDARDENGELLPDSVRLTRFGKLLRSLSIDELPELWNILKGDMSLIGPRPLLVQYLPLYNERQSHRHDVRPGLTGLAQVNGRNALSWEEKFEYDVEYTEKISFSLDVKIFFKTIVNVLRREGIQASENTTMEVFTGSPVEKTGGKEDE